MGTQVLRIKMFLKRKILRLFGFKPFVIASIHNYEKPANALAQRAFRYSESIVHKGIDVRNERSKGHFFVERNGYKISDVILEPKQGILYNQNGELIIESTSWSALHQYVSFPWNPRKIRKTLNTENGIILSSNPYGHWLIEDLPVTIAAMEFDSSAPLLVSRKHPKYVSDFLETTQTKVVYLDHPMKISSVLIVEKGFDSGWVHPVDRLTLRNYGPFATAMNSKKYEVDRIYATRKGLNRSPKNEADIEKLFANFGFEIYDLSKMNLLEEIGLISSCKVLAGVHGSSFTNEVWMKENSLAFEIINRNYWTEMDHEQFIDQKIEKETFLYQGEPNAAVPLESLELKLKALFPK
jgi:hypothetical protein